MLAILQQLKLLIPWGNVVSLLLKPLQDCVPNCAAWNTLTLVWPQRGSAGYGFTVLCSSLPLPCLCSLGSLSLAVGPFTACFPILTSKTLSSANGEVTWVWISDHSRWLISLTVWALCCGTQLVIFHVRTGVVCWDAGFGEVFLLKWSLKAANLNF